MEFVKCEIGRVDKPLKSYMLEEGSTVADLLVKSELEIVKGEGIKDFDDNVILKTAILEDGKTYFLVGNLEQGSY